MSKICNNVKYYIMTAIWWSFNVKVLYWWRLTIKKLKRFVCESCLYSTLLINYCVRNSAIIQYECIVKRWHHTNSTAIVSYISNTLSNLRLARNWPTGVKSAHRWWFKLMTFWTYSLTMNLNHQQRWPRHYFMQVITH